jgi:hypothetical protein
MKWRIVHVPGYSGVDHVGPELVRLAGGPYASRRAAEAAIARAYRRARQLAEEAPLSYSVYRFLLPRLEARRDE